FSKKEDGKDIYVRDILGMDLCNHPLMLFSHGISLRTLTDVSSGAKPFQNAYVPKATCFLAYLGFMPTIASLSGIMTRKMVQDLYPVPHKDSLVHRRLGEHTFMEVGDSNPFSIWSGQKVLTNYHMGCFIRDMSAEVGGKRDAGTCIMKEADATLKAFNLHWREGALCISEAKIPITNDLRVLESAAK
ncbi:unnamed protein product, partial [Chrysoparadoxa australica]